MSLWCDVSGSYAIVPTPQQVADLRALGFVGAIVGSSYMNNVAQAQLAAFEAGGMRTEEYLFPAALKATERRWWVDAELPDATREALRNALRIGSLGPYSRKGWADDYLPDWDCKAEFPNAELWDARYVHGDGPCRIQYAIDSGGDVLAAIESERSWISPFKPYWGFKKAKITQFHNSITICGVNMDLNEVEEERMFTDKEIDAKIGALLSAISDANINIGRLQTGMDFLIAVANNLAPRIDALEKK